MQENICHFIPYRNDYHSIHTINFVLETKPQIKGNLQPCSTYRVYYVKSGSGNLHTTGKVIKLKKHDVFVIFPDFTYSIESIENFSFMYISFLGSRSNMIIDKLGISSSNFYFENCKEICEFCERGITINQEFSDWIAESILLFTFSVLSSMLFPLADTYKDKNNIVLVIKKLIDDNFSNSNISLTYISREICYSSKYISTLFKKTFKIGITEYINTLRIQHACTLMQQGFTSIIDISAQCGFSDPQYFSKVFKRKMAVSPKNYIATLKNGEM